MVSRPIRSVEIYLITSNKLNRPDISVRPNGAGISWSKSKSFVQQLGLVKLDPAIS